MKFSYTVLFLFLVLLHPLWHMVVACIAVSGKLILTKTSIFIRALVEHMQSTLRDSLNYKAMLLKSYFPFSLRATDLFVVPIFGASLCNALA